MFPEREGRRPVPLFPPRPVHRRPPQRFPMESFLTPFQNSQGELDMGKILKTIDQVNGIVKQVRPLFSEWTKR